jgi:hypothetical protein
VGWLPWYPHLLLLLLQLLQYWAPEVAWTQRVVAPQSLAAAALMGWRMLLHAVLVVGRPSWVVEQQVVVALLCPGPQQTPPHPGSLAAAACGGVHGVPLLLLAQLPLPHACQLLLKHQHPAACAWRWEWAGQQPAEHNRHRSRSTARYALGYYS